MKTILTAIGLAVALSAAAALPTSPRALAASPEPPLPSDAAALPDYGQLPPPGGELPPLTPEQRRALAETKTYAGPARPVPSPPALAPIPQSNPDAATCAHITQRYAETWKRINQMNIGNDAALRAGLDQWQALHQRFGCNPWQIMTILEQNLSGRRDGQWK